MKLDKELKAYIAIILALFAMEFTLWNYVQACERPQFMVDSNDSAMVAGIKLGIY